MFAEKYKSAMNDIKPSEAALKATLDGMNKSVNTGFGIRNHLRIALISVFAIILITLTVFAALNMGNTTENSIQPIESIVPGIDKNESSDIQSSKSESQQGTFESSNISENTNNNSDNESSDTPSLPEDGESSIPPVESSDIEISDGNNDDPSEENDNSAEPEWSLPSIPDEDDGDNTPPINENNGLTPVVDYDSLSQFAQNAIDYNSTIIDYPIITPNVPDNEQDNNVENGDGVESDGVVIPDEPGDGPDSLPEGDDSTTNTDIPEFSGTNSLVDNTIEPDIVKTDGKYIYSTQKYGKQIYITEVNGSEMKQTSVIDMIPRNMDSAHDLFIYKNKLIIIGRFVGGIYNETVCNIYDVTDKSNPTLLYTLRQDGEYVNSRFIDGHVYIMSNNYSCSPPFIGDISPKINREPMEAKDIYIPEYIPERSEFCIITAYNIENGKDSFSSQIAIFGSGYWGYADEENLYITHYLEKTDFDSYKNGESVATSDTYIFRIAFNSGNLKADGFGVVPGSAYVNEHNGYLRVISRMYQYTVNRNVNGEIESLLQEDPFLRFYVLDKDLEICGVSETFAHDKLLGSTKFIGNIAYVSTFSRTDPIFIFDFSDPKKPKMIHELELNGYSTYMQTYSEDLLLGIGYETDSESGKTSGLKLTMFDISNKGVPDDISTYRFVWSHGVATTATALSEYKALLMDNGKQIIAIPVEYTGYEVDELFGDIVTSNKRTYYVFFEFDGENLTEKASILFSEEEFVDYSDMRGLYIGDYVYIVEYNKIICISLESYETVGSIEY